MPRVIWKGAISFGLVHIPVVLHAASAHRGLSFDLVDKRSADPIGYRKYNKTTGKDVDNEHIVRAFEYEKGHYVMLSDEEIKSANAESTQTVDIVAFVDGTSVPFLYLETPYYLAPEKRGAKVYALLRESLLRSKKIGIAKVVLHTKEHLAAIVPLGKLLVLNTLRWADEVIDAGSLDLPAGGKSEALTARELQMAEKLIGEMTVDWEPADYHDRFREDVEGLIARKVKSGKTHVIDDGGTSTQKRLPAPTSTAELTALLKDSLRAVPASTRKSTSPKTTPRKKSATKTPSRRTSTKKVTKTAKRTRRSA